MSNFEEICLLSCEKWVDSFPDDIPKHKFSEKHEKIMKPLLACQSKDNKRRLSGKIIRFLIIAAVIMAVAATVFAIPLSRKFIIERFSDHSEYSVQDTSEAQEVKSLELNYVPTGFKKTEDYGYIYLYENGNKYFSVEKMDLNSTVGFDTEKYEYEHEYLIINDANAIYYQSSENVSGILFNNGNYIFLLDGNIGKDELVKIAQNVK